MKNLDSFAINIIKSYSMKFMYKQFYQSFSLIAMLLMSGLFVNAQTPDVNGIYYVKPVATGTGSGDSWTNATADLENVIYYAGSGSKVFMAIGNYNVPVTSYKLKNNLEIYGGFDPSNGITNLSHNRILPSESVEGTVFNGQGTRRVFDNNFTFSSLNNTAVLDGVTLKNGYTNSDNGAGMQNINASPILRNIVIRNNNANNGAGGAMYNDNSSPIITNMLVLNNFSGANKAAYHSVNLSNSQITNSIFKGNSQRIIHTENASLNSWNVLMADNPAATVALAHIGSGNTNIYNSTIININGSNNAIDAFFNSGIVSVINSIVYGVINNATLSSCLHSLDLTTVSPSSVFADYTNGNYQLRYNSPAIDAGSNSLYSGLDANTKDLAGNPRVYQYSSGGIIDKGAYEFCMLPDANGIVYVKPSPTGTGTGNSWENATSNLQGAINATGTTKVFVAIGYYNAPLVGSFVMKNNVEIYGGFDPDNGISTLSHNRIMPSETVNGSVMNGQNQVSVVRNVFASGNPLNNTAILDGFTITNGNRTTTGYGGGIELQNASPILRNLVIKNNSVQDGGGAMGITQNSSPTISNIYLLNNTTPGISGGVIIQSNSNPSFTNVYFKGNTASNSTQGSAIANYNGCSPTFINLMLTTTANSTLNSITTTNSGGGTGILTLINASIYTSSNNAAGVVPAISSIAGATVNAKNSIIYGANSTATGGVINLQSTQHYPTASTVLPTTVFMDPANNNFALKEGSPAINVGDNSLFPGLVSTTKDLAGNARLHLYGMGGIIDLGPYESAFLQPDANGVVYVKPTATGTGSGDSWANATGDLQLAINTTGVQKVFVSVGWYVTPTNGFVMKNNVEIYGGFNPGSGITDLSHQRQFFLGSVLSGENTVRVINNDFLSATALNATAVLDGFTITKGYVSDDFGAGMLNRNASPTLRYVTFLNNHAVGTSGSGGGMANLNNSAPNLTNGSFTFNSADAQGAAVYNASSSNGLFKTCQITNNECPDGSALYAVNSSPTILNSRLSENHGLNTVSINGSSSGITFINVTVANNTQVNAGVSPNVLALGNGAVGAIKNSIVFGTISGAGSYTAQYSFIEGNSSTANGNVNTTGYTIADIYINPTNGAYDLKGTAPVINKGSNALFTGLNSNSTDMAGNPRLVGAIIDLGATEFIVSSGGNGIAYVKPTATGSGNGSSWANATSDLQAAINATGTQKVFVAKGLYHVPSPSSYVMKNDVEIYGGFDPDNGISDLTHNRIMPGLGNQGSILDGNNERPIIWNYNNGVTSTAKLDGFTLTNAKGVNQGAIHNNATSPTLTNLLIVNNDSYGIYNQSSSSTITNSAVLKNSGRGVHFSGVGNATLVNVTIAGNGGEAVYALNTDPMSNFSVVLNNSVVYGTVTNSLSQAIANYSLVENNALSGNNAVDATGISANQVFVDESNDDFSIKGSSPAVNAGNNALFIGLNSSSRDLLGNVRLYGSTIDLGAYEFYFQSDINGVSYVKTVATGSGDGSSWSNATADLQAAINTTGTQKVFVAKGVYDVPSPNSFVMKNGVEIYGGFDPDNGISDLTHNRIMPATGQGSVLDGKNERPIIWNWNNGVTTTSKLDGFALTNAKGVNQAAIVNNNTSPMLVNLLIHDNHTSGIVAINASSPTIVNSSIVKNEGKGVYFVGTESLTITNVTIAGNTQDAVYAYNTATAPNFNVSFKNSIVFGSVTNPSSQATAQFSLIENNAITGSNNIDATGILEAAIFSDPSTGDYQLTNSSVAIDAGNNALFTGLNTGSVDLAGNSRIYNAMIDLGAFERQCGAAITSTDLISACDSVTWIDGNLYTVDNNTAQVTLQSVNGCDSIVSLNLTIFNSTHNSTTQSTCDSYFWNGTTYTSGGTYFYNYTNAYGCASVDTLHLTLSSVVTAISNVGNTISAYQSGATYQWIDCSTNTPIVGATNQSFTATQNGDYAVIVIDGSCSDTSDCVSITTAGLSAIALNDWKVYPVPTSTDLTIASSTPMDVEILDMLGKKVMQINLKEGTTIIDVQSLTNGVYFVKRNDGESLKFIKE